MAQFRLFNQQILCRGVQHEFLSKVMQNIKKPITFVQDH